MSARILRLEAVLNKTGVSRSLLYQLMSEGSFPRQIHLGARSVGWVETEIDDWIHARISLSRPVITGVSSKQRCAGS